MQFNTTRHTIAMFNQMQQKNRSPLFVGPRNPIVNNQNLHWLRKKCTLIKLTSFLSAAGGHIPTANEARMERSSPVRENWRLRQNLALSYRLFDDLSLNEVTIIPDDVSLISLTTNSLLFSVDILPE